MRPFPLRRLPRAERSRTPLWLWPATSGAAALVAALFLGRLRPEPGSVPAWLWPGGMDAAVTMLQVVTTASVTAATLTFSLTLVALQLASQQFSPRLLRRFAHDRVIKAVLAVLTATFAFALTTLAFLDGRQPLPAVALFVVSVSGVASLAAVLGFLTHMVREVRVDNMLLAIHDETEDAIRLFYRTDGPSSRSWDPPQDGWERGGTVYGRRSGFVRLVDTEALVEYGHRHDVVVRLDVCPGDLSVVGTPIATVWARDPSAGKLDPYADGTAAAVTDALMVGYERSMEQDVAFGFRQLEDIAVKAMSPAINDPATACTAVGHMADLLVKLAGRHLGLIVHPDADGVVRVIVPDRDLRYYLGLTCGQLRRYAAAEPTVLVALLRMLRDLATAVRDDDRHAAEVRREADRIREALAPTVSSTDAEQVHDLHRRVLEALDGRTVRAYLDRSGETRSF